jgi:hypothetical protein
MLLVVVGVELVVELVVDADKKQLVKKGPIKSLLKSSYFALKLKTAQTLLKIHLSLVIVPSKFILFVLVASNFTVAANGKRLLQMTKRVSLILLVVPEVASIK